MPAARALRTPGTLSALSPPCALPSPLPSPQIDAPAADTLKWSFGATVDSTRHGFTLQSLAGGSPAGGASAGAGAPASGAAPSAGPWRRAAVAFLGVQGSDSTAVLRDDASVLCLTLVSGSLATIVYRMMDEDSEWAAAAAAAAAGGRCRWGGATG